MRYRELFSLPEGQGTPTPVQKAASAQRQKAKASQALDTARRTQNDALRRLHDKQAKAREQNDPGKAADATRAYSAKVSQARTKAQNAQARLSKPSA